MTLTITSVILETPEPYVAEAGYTAAFGLGDKLSVRPATAPTLGFRGFVLSLVVSQPSTVDNLMTPALEAGFTVLKPAKMGFWGYGGVIQAPDGAIWKIATSAKKDTGPSTREVDDVVLLLGVTDVKATKQFYIDHGMSVAKSFGSKYVEFASAGSGIKLALYGRRFAAKDAGVSPEGSGSHRVAIVKDTASFTDPDGFDWERA
ncbi:glyoxalase [Microbacterium sp.]|uniref:glyoxalase n=1 Tax=Microbacterium sp. TaxID=51671 RepID=UPI0039E59DFC